MPELPEVEALVGFLTKHAVGRAIARIDVAAFSVLKTYDPPASALSGLEITGVHRWGKFLGLELSNRAASACSRSRQRPSGLYLITHLSRAGWLRWSDALPSAPSKPGKGPLALRVHLDDGSGFDLTEAGTQKRLAVYVVRSPYEVPGIARLGPDPLRPGFDETTLAGLLAASPRKQLKGLLKDQSVIAGVGNAYSDEVLHMARMSPFRLAGTLSPDDVALLYDALRKTLSEAIERAEGLEAGKLKAEKKSALRVHGRAGEPCLVCGDVVREVSFADSALQYCPTCQTGGKLLADRRLSRLLK